MMVDISKKEKLAIRKRIFLHLDGWALIPTIYNLNKLGVLQLLEENHTISLKDINAVAKTNFINAFEAFQRDVGNNYFRKTFFKFFK